MAGIDGLFCATDSMAPGSLDALRFDMGLKVPEVLWVVGFEDIEQAGLPAGYDPPGHRCAMRDGAGASDGADRQP